MTRKGNSPPVSAAYEEIIEKMEAGEPVSLSARPGAFEVAFGPRIATVPEQTWLAVLGAARRHWA
ncbi:MAG: hypothetical protein ACREJ6_06685, partial [Candidatus Methylomirabilis sp.]